MILGLWNVRNYWFKPSERKRMTKIVNALLLNGWEFVTGGIDENGVWGDDDISYYKGYEELQIQKLNGHNNL
jgi:hypothetical protein